MKLAGEGVSSLPYVPRAFDPRLVVVHERDARATGFDLWWAAI